MRPEHRVDAVLGIDASLRAARQREDTARSIMIACAPRETESQREQWHRAHDAAVEAGRDIETLERVMRQLTGER